MVHERDDDEPKTPWYLRIRPADALIMATLIFNIGITFQRLNALEEWRASHEVASEKRTVEFKSEDLAIRQEIERKLGDFERRDVLAAKLDTIDVRLSRIERALTIREATDPITRKQVVR